MTKEQKKYLIKHFNFDENNKKTKYLYEISEKILAKELYYAQDGNDLDKADFFYDLYDAFREEYDNGDFYYYDMGLKK